MSMSSQSTEPSLPAAPARWHDTLGWCPGPVQQQQFQGLYAGILQGNQQMNLTRITEPTDFWEKHLWDSLSGLWPWLQPQEQQPVWGAALAVERVIDIGTGAGLPGLPAAIALPHWQITLLDSTQKKVRFLATLAQDLELGRVQAIADRAETLGRQPAHRNHYDLALLRAVGPATTCAEYALPLLRVGGVAVLYRGQWSKAENQSLSQALALLGGQILAVRPWQTPLSHSMRHCVYLQKSQPTPDTFPRATGIPAKQPLAPTDHRLQG